MTNNHEAAAAVKETAARLGFDACGIAAAGAIDPGDRLGAWLAKGCHAGMAWLARNKEVRQDIRLKLPGAKSVVVVARNYYAQHCGAGVPPVPLRTGRVARYAWGRDYHEVLAKPLHVLADQITAMGEGIRCYCSIDTGPVMEKAWAQRAGVGWIGKNSLVVRDGLGTWFFLGVVATTLELEPDAPALDQCGSCRLCLDACPTGALVEPRVLDARKCLSYLTIENRGDIPEDLAASLGDRIFGCDACQEACPWNQRVKTTTEPAFNPESPHATIDLDALLAMDEHDFVTTFDASPVLRASLPGMKRTARILLGNKEKPQIT